MNEYSTNWFLLVECSKHLSLKIYLINFLHENCTDDGERCDSFTHMYQNPNVLECKKNLYSKIAIQNF